MQEIIEETVSGPIDFIKKPVKIQSMHLLASNAQKVAEWCGGEVMFDGIGLPYIEISTLEGVMRASMGDWVVKGVKGEFYPVREDIFHATYERA